MIVPGFASAFLVGGGGCVVPRNDFEHGKHVYYVWPLTCARQDTVGAHVRENLLFEGRV